MGTTKKFLPKLNHYAHFTPLADIIKGHPTRKFARPKLPTAFPPVTLPVDWTNNAAVSCPMDGNDQYGDCMYAMACHCDNVATYMIGKGTESTFVEATIVSDYLALSGGDNGLDEGTLVGAWENTGLAGVPAAKIVESLDIDVTDANLVQFAMDNGFYTCVMWAVPDDFISGFAQGTVWANADTPDPANGHGTPLIDIAGPSDTSGGVALNGFYRLWTWGTWCWVSPAFIASVTPSAFVVFSTRGFDPATGLDAKGVHITARAATWQQCGGTAIPASVINAFPPVSPTPVPPTPTPVPPTPTPVPPPNTLIEIVNFVFGLAEEVLSSNPAAVTDLQAVQKLIVDLLEQYGDKLHVADMTKTKDLLKHEFLKHRKMK